MHTYTNTHTHTYKHIKGAWWDCSTHVWASERGAISVGCGPLNGPVSPGESGPMILLLKLPAH